jgi:hypothetical protein
MPNITGIESILWLVRRTRCAITSLFVVNDATTSDKNTLQFGIVAAVVAVVLPVLVLAALTIVSVVPGVA